MKLTRSVGYAVGILLRVQGATAEGPMTADSISQGCKFPPRFLYRVLRRLVDAGLLQGISGPRGGYTLAKPSRQVRLLEIVQAVEEGAGSGGLVPVNRQQKPAIDFVKRTLWSRTLLPANAESVSQSHAGPNWPSCRHAGQQARPRAKTAGRKRPPPRKKSTGRKMRLREVSPDAARSHRAGDPSSPGPRILKPVQFAWNTPTRAGSASRSATEGIALLRSRRRRQLAFQAAGSKS